jgi:two-component system phosphate regulon sensor histidine kinase PhoR
VRKEQDIMQETSWMQVLRDVVHDLKAPLSSIKILIDGMEEVGELNDKQQHFAERARVKLIQMVTMLNTIMEMAWIDSDQPMQWAMIDLEAVIRRQIVLLEDVAAQRHVEMRVMLPERIGLIEADERMINQMILNLLSNAIKYNTENGFVNVQVNDAPEQVTILIEDCGRGIPLDDQPFIFDRFFRSRETGKVEGTGLGLSIVKAAVDRHLGTISVKSEPNQGAAFTVILPRRRGTGSSDPAGGDELHELSAPNQGDEISDAVDDRIQESHDVSDDIADSHARAGRQ